MITMMNILSEPLFFFLSTSARLIFLFMTITTVVEVILMYLSPERIRRMLSTGAGSSLGGNLTGALLGALTPFCACSTIPLFTGMLRAQAPIGAALSFLIASPMLNPLIIGMLLAFLGWKAAMVYFITGILNAVLFGYFLQRAGAEKYLKSTFASTGCCGGQKVPAGIAPKLGKAFTLAWTKSLRPVLVYLLAGTAIGAAIYGYLPSELVLQLAGPENPLAVPVAAVIGVPLYIRAEAAIAIGAALMGKGMSVGAVVALVVGGAGMAIPEMSLLAGIFRKKLIAMIILTIFFTAVTGGLAFNLLF